jgi:hypothetical protein
MTCAICGIRRARRHCPGVHGEICSLCCGTGREVTVNCPLDCRFLEEARLHERTAPVNPDEFPNQDVKVTEQFIQDHGPLLEFLGQWLLTSALQTPGAIDFDVREALESMIRTYRTLGSGVYYETRPNNTVANEIFTRMQAGIEQFRREESERGMTSTRDRDVLGVLAFLQRLEIDRNNRRARGRAFIDFLRGEFSSDATGPEPGPTTSGSLILP